MKSTLGSWPARVCARGVFSCAMLLVGAVSLLFMCMGPIVYSTQGFAGLQVAATAGLLSLMVGVGVILLSHHPALRQKPLVSLLMATFLRMVPLLIVGLVVAMSRDRSEHLPFVVYLICFYLGTLAVETFVSVQLVKANANSSLSSTQLPKHNSPSIT